MVRSKPKLVDQLEADPLTREANGEFLFTGAGGVLLALRRTKNLSLAEVGAALGVAASTVMRYEKNDTPLSDYAVSRFAEVYEVDAERLMLDCMTEVLPGMADSPLGHLLARVVDANLASAPPA